MLVNPLMLFCCSDGKTRHGDEKWTKKKCMTKGGSWQIFFSQSVFFVTISFFSTLLIMACQCFRLCRQAHPISSLSFSFSKWFLTLTAQSGYIKRNFVKQISEKENMFHSQLDGHFSSHWFVLTLIKIPNMFVFFLLQNTSTIHEFNWSINFEWSQAQLVIVVVQVKRQNVCKFVLSNWLGTNWLCYSRDLE